MTIQLHSWATPNGWKISIALEELGLPYVFHPVDIGRGAQFEPSFLAISPNNRIPAIVDDSPADGGAPISVFESGAILLYLAEKTGKLLPSALRGRVATTEWLMWQMGGLGPMSGQAGHFTQYAPERIPYAIERYGNEVRRLYRVLDTRLTGRDFLADEYTIADIACFAWVRLADRFGVDLGAEFPRVARWVGAIAARPAVQRGLLVGTELRQNTLDDEARRILFGQK